MALSIPHGVTLQVVNIDIPCHQGRCHKFFSGLLVGDESVGSVRETLSLCGSCVDIL